MSTIEKSDEYVSLARASYTAFVEHGQKISVPDNLPSQMTSEQAGVFVSLHEHGELRGCIGTIAPMQDCVAEEIISNAISACSQDPRFPAITPSELPDIECSVDVLTPFEDVDSADSLDPKRYGVIVSRGFARGVLLPDLEGVDTVEQQVAIAKQKAGIPLSSPCHLQRFEVIRHH